MSKMPYKEYVKFLTNETCGKLLANKIFDKFSAIITLSFS